MKKKNILKCVSTGFIVVTMVISSGKMIYAADNAKLGESAQIGIEESYKEGSSPYIESVDRSSLDGAFLQPECWEPESASIEASAKESSAVPELYDDAKEAFATSGTGGFVSRMYRKVLGREPDQKGYDDWVSGLNSGALSASDIVTNFFSSEEYQLKHKSNSAIVTDFYVAMMDRNPDPEGLKYWVDRLNIGMTEQAVAAGFVDSREFEILCSSYGINRGTITLTAARDQNYNRTYFVYRLYKNCLNRDPDIDGEEYWCSMIGSGTGGTEVAKGFVFSKEYKLRHVRVKL